MELTLHELKTLMTHDESSSIYQELIGKKVLIRTVTYAQVGRLRCVGQHELILDDASWVGDTGRFSVALEKGELSEVEYVGTMCIVVRVGIIDVWPWNHPLPTKTI